MKHFLLSSLSLVLFLFISIPSTIQAQNALNFDGTNDLVQTTYPGVLGAANRTFEAWIRVGPSVSANQAILDYGLNAVGSRNTWLVNANYQLSFIAGGTNTNFSSSTNAISPNVWTHVAMVMSNGTGFMYVNGVQVGTGNLSNVNTPSGNSDVRIGNRVAGGNIPFEGDIDEVRIWDVALTAGQIQANMNREFCVIPSNLKAYYQFNQGTAGGSNGGVSTLDDNSGNSNPGTMSGFALTGVTSNWVTGVSLTTDVVGGVSTVSECIPYTTPGNRVLTTSGPYLDTVATSSGCDSVYTINFTALTNSSSTNTVAACDSYTTPGGKVVTVSGTVLDTISNTAGCDSLMTINVTIMNTTFISESDTACDSYTSPSGKTWTSTGSYQDTILSGAACDTIYTISLVIDSSASTSIAESSCGAYTSNQGNTYDTTGVYTEMFQTSEGCDSVVTLDLTITNTDTSVTQTGMTLSANQAGAIYQWYDCTNQTAVSGETSQSFTPSISGIYLVEIQNGSCLDSSVCYYIDLVGIQEIDKQLINIYPNPTKGLVTIDMGVAHEAIWIEVLDIQGKIVNSIEVGTATQVQLELGHANGLYTVLVRATDGFHAFKVMKLD